MPLTAVARKQSRKPRRRPVHIKRYSEKAKQDYTTFALHFGVDYVANLFDVDRRTLVRWVTEHRRSMNGGIHPAAPAPGAEGDVA